MRLVKDFLELHLVNRRPLGDKRGSVEYFLTDKGRELVDLIWKILKLEE